MSSSLGKNIILYGLADVITKCISFFVFPIYAYLFSTDEFGVMALVITMGGLLGTISNIGMNNAVQRYYFEKPLAKAYVVSSGFWISIVWAVITTLLFIGVTYGMKNILFLKFGIHFHYIFLNLISNFIMIIFIFSQNVARLHFAPIKFMVVTLINNLLGVGLGLICIIYFELGLTGFFLGQCIAYFIALPVDIYIMKSELKFAFSKRLGKQLIQFGAPFIFVNIAFWLFGSIDRWMLGSMASTSEVGIYSVAGRFGMIIMLVSSAFGQAWSPFSIQLFSEKKDYKIIYGHILTVWFSLILMIGFGICLFGQEFIMILFPKEYELAIYPLIFIIFGVVLQSTTQVTASGISLSKKTYLFSNISWVMAGLNILLNYFLIPIFDATGAAIATFICYLFLTLCYLYFSQKYHPFKLEKMKFFILLVLMTSAIIITFIISGSAASIPVFFIKIGLLLSGFILMFVLRILNKENLSSVFTMVK